MRTPFITTHRVARYTLTTWDVNMYS
jgi:hypothetical protein